MEPKTPSPRMDIDVLVVGAGPTGLVLALWLRRLGVPVRIVDKREGPGETSRALAVQARTLEFYRQIGIVDDVLAAGLRIDQLTIRTPAGVAAALKLGEFGEGLSPYPFAFALPQDIHERILSSIWKGPASGWSGRRNSSASRRPPAASPLRCAGTAPTRPSGPPISAAATAPTAPCATR